MTMLSFRSQESGVRSQENRARSLFGKSVGAAAVAILVWLATTVTGSAQVNKLAAVLKSDATQKEKADACRELAQIGTKEAVAPLAALLADEKLSHMARYGLETIPDASVDQAFRDALPKLKGRPLVGVIGSIGVRKDPAAVKPLANLLRDSDTDVAQAAARSLGKIATAEAAKALQDSLTGASGAQELALCEGLLRCAETFSAKGNRRQAIAVYDLLCALPTAAHPIPHQVRTAALRGAMLTRGDSDLKLMKDALLCPDLPIFATATRTSLEMPGQRVTLALAAALEKAAADRQILFPADHQILLIQTLAKRADTKALPALFTAAKKCEKSVRVAAIRAIGEIGSPTALPTLMELMHDADREIAQPAQESLAGIQGKEVDAAVLALLAKQEPKERVLGIDLTARRRMTGAVPQLLQAAGGTDTTVRLAALRKLGGLAAPADLPNLINLLSQAKSAEDLEAAEQAVSTLCLRAPEPAACVDKLAAGLAQTEPAQRCALLRVIAAAGGSPALKCIRASVNDSAPNVRAAAIRALAAWNNAEAAPDLLDLARNTSNTTEKALCLRGYLGFARHTDTPAAQRLAMCGQAASLAQTDDEKKLLLSALGTIQSADAVALIQPYLENEGTREEAASAAVGIADKLLQGNQAAGVAPKLIAPLEKVTQVTQNSDLAARAKSLLEKAQKAGAK